MNCWSFFFKRPFLVLQENVAFSSFASVKVWKHSQKKTGSEVWWIDSGMTGCMHWKESEMKIFSFPLCSLHCFMNKKLWFCVSEEKCRSFIELSPPAERGKSKFLYFTVAIECVSWDGGPPTFCLCGNSRVSPQRARHKILSLWLLKEQRFPPRCLHKPLLFVKSVLENSDSLQYEVGFVSCSKLRGLELSSWEEDGCSLRAVPPTQATC